MIRSKNIQDYVQAPLSEVTPELPLPCDLHLYFTRNQHVLIWFKAGTSLSEAFLKRYIARGVSQVWIHRDDLERFKASVPEPVPIEATTPTPPQTDATSASAPADTAPVAPAPALEAPPARDHGKRINALLKNETLESRKKTALVAKNAREALKDSVKDVAAGRKVVKDVLEQLPDDARQMAQEIWNLSDQTPEIEHGVNVATYAVLLALAFGKIDQMLIGDLALAGILHDVGISQIPVEIASRPWRDLTAQQARIYESHVEGSSRLIEALAPKTPERVKFLVSQHQEKFDGSGYPQHLQGFKIDGIGTLLAIAEMLETFASGQWDGLTRSYPDALDALEHLEKARTFPEFFNPEILSAVLRWTRSAEADDRVALAKKTVEDQAKGIMKQEAS